jgi:DNA-binding transcriptional LysR family regulator
MELTARSAPRLIADVVIEKSYTAQLCKPFYDVRHGSQKLYSDVIWTTPDMNDRQLRYACAVWREHSFSKAGAKLAVSQPSLSAQIRALEEELGFDLFYRGSRGVEPSVDGLAFLEAAEQVVFEMAGLKDFGRELRGKAGPHIRIGISSGIAQAFVPRIIEGLTHMGRVYPEISTATSRRIQRLVHEQRLDIGILFANDITMSRHNLAVEPIASTDIIALMPPDHALAKDGGTLTLAEVAAHPIILCEPRLGYGRSIIDAFDHAGLQPNIVADCDNAESLKYMVLAGAGLGILPRMAVENEVQLGLFTAMSFEPRQSVSVQLVRRTDVSPLWPQWVTQGMEQLVKNLLETPTATATPAPRVADRKRTELAVRKIR